MDLRKYAPKYIKPEHVEEAPIRARIVAVLENEKFERPMLELDNGAQFTLWEKNYTVLVAAWGADSKDFIGQEIELAHGTYTDWKTKEEKGTVIVHAVSPPKHTTQANGSEPLKPPLPPPRTTSLKDALDDDIPF